MIPRWLEIEGIRSFVAPRRIDFADLGLFAVLGDTGAGKSSILEAIVYALFNGTTWDGKSVTELMSIGATRMRVRFCFSLNDRTYTVSRSKPRDGVGSHLLECRGPLDERLDDERCDGEGAVNRRLETLLGVNRETFTKTVVLPQGEFAALLALADKPAKRTELLTSLLGLDRLDAMVATLAAPRERARGLRAQLQGARSRLPADPAAAVALAQAATASAGERRTVLDGALEKLAVRQRALDALAAATAARGKLREQLAIVPKNVTALEALLTEDASLESDTATALACRRTADSALAAADAELRRRASDGLDAVALASVASLLDKLAAEVRERTRERGDETQRRDAATATAEAVSEAAAHWKTAEETASAARALFAATQAAASAANATLQTAQDVSRNLAQARETWSEATTNAELGAASVKRAANAYERAVEADRAAESALATAEAHVLDTQRANAAAFAAQCCSDGEPCPVCARQLPADFTPPRAADLETAQRGLNEARTAAQAAHKQLATAFAARSAAEQSHAEAVARATASSAARDRALDAARAAGLDPTAADSAGALAALRAASLERQAEFEAADEARRQADAQVAEQRATHAATVRSDERAKHELANCRARIERREETLRSLLDALPAAYRPPLEPDAIEVIVRDVHAALDEARRFEQMRNAVALDAKDAEADVRRLEARRALEIVAPMRALRSSLIVAALALEDDTRQGGSGASEAVAATPRDDAELAEVIRWARVLADAVSAALRTINAADAADALQVETERAETAELFREQGVTGSAALIELRDEALQAEAVAKQTLELAHAARSEAAELDANLAKLDPLARALDALHSALGDGKFKRFVAARKEQRLLGVATTILGRMTDERYGFGAAMRIVDRAAGQERSPQTLSGGEKFLASLALAFALVEIAARSGGHFGALFLDEGFGSLDLHALDQALSELERQAARGRMIGVITHVREVTEYIDDVLRVWRTPTGSDVARLDRADLDALVAETATVAIGGV